MAEFITLAEMAGRAAAEGAIAEQLNKISPLLSLMPFEIRPGGVKKYGVRESLPQIGWRGANDTITPSASVINPYSEECGILENNPWIDKAVVDGDPVAAMAQELVANVEALSQAFANAFYYGDRATDPKELDGLYTRILASGDQFLGGSGTGTDVTSVYVVNFGRNEVQGIIPKEEAAFDAQMLPGLVKHATKGIMGYQGHVYAKVGIAVCSPFAVAQYGNLETAGSSNLFDLDAFEEVLSRVKGSGQTIALMPSKVWVRFNQLARTKVTLTSDELGRRFLDYGGTPVYLDENIVLTETAK